MRNRQRNGKRESKSEWRTFSGEATRQVAADNKERASERERKLPEKSFSGSRTHFFALDCTNKEIGLSLALTLQV